MRPYPHRNVFDIMCICGMYITLIIKNLNNKINLWKCRHTTSTIIKKTYILQTQTDTIKN